MTTAPLKLFWWRAVPNFGDSLSKLVVAHVSGRVVEHARPFEAEMFAIGSLMRAVRRNRLKLKNPVIWGTGMLGPLPADFLPQIQIACLRGPIGADLLGVKTKNFGDPGLLTAEALGPVERQDVIGIVLHHSQSGDPRVAQLAAQDARVRIIDVAGDCETVCREIAGCAHVFSSSLHGLIVADAYGVANTWLHPGEHGHFKYYDYAASIARPLSGPLEIDDLPSAIAAANDAPLTYTDGIQRCQGILRETFPAHMRATETLETS